MTQKTTFQMLKAKAKHWPMAVCLEKLNNSTTNMERHMAAHILRKKYSYPVGNIENRFSMAVMYFSNLHIA